MVQQKYSWEYCRETTYQHHIAKKYKQCVEDIDIISKAEGVKSSPFSDQKCINLDKVEIFLAKKERRDRQNTMDISFGITSGNQKRFLLCEYKLGVRNLNNLRRGELDSKIKCSKSLLGQNPVIHNRYLFIFNSKVKQQARSRLRRLFENRNIADAIDLHDLKKRYFK